MRVMIVAPGPKFSTYDTFRYYHDAFLELGHEVFAFKYHDHYAYHATALAHLEGKSGEEFELQQRAITLSVENLISRAARTKPALMFIISGLALPMGTWDWLEIFQGALKEPYKTMVLFTESPYIDEHQFPVLQRTDLAATMDLASLDKFKGVNKNTIYVRHAQNPTIHRMQPISAEHSADVFMVGTGFPERIKLLAGVDWSGIDLRLFGGNWNDIEDGNAFVDHYTAGFLDNEAEVPKYYSNSKINLNIFRTAKWPGKNVLHVAPEQAHSLSPRCYEVMACGGFLLTDTRPELYELFDVGKDLVVFDGAEDLGNKIGYYLAHEAERKKIALSGYRAVREHTYTDRAEQIVEFVTKN